MDPLLQKTCRNGYLFSILDLHDILDEMKISNEIHIEITDRLKHSMSVREATGWTLPEEEGKIIP